MIQLGWICYCPQSYLKTLTIYLVHTISRILGEDMNNLKGVDEEIQKLCPLHIKLGCQSSWYSGVTSEELSPGTSSSANTIVASLRSLLPNRPPVSCYLSVSYKLFTVLFFWKLSLTRGNKSSRNAGEVKISFRGSSWPVTLRHQLYRVISIASSCDNSVVHSGYSCSIMPH